MADAKRTLYISWYYNVIVGPMMTMSVHNYQAYGIVDLFYRHSAFSTFFLTLEIFLNIFSNIKKAHFRAYLKSLR